MVWISRANLPETAGTAGHTHSSGSSSSNSPLHVRDTQASMGCGRYASAMDAPLAVFTPSGDFANSASSHHALPSQIDNNKPREQIHPYQPSDDSIVSVYPQCLKRKRDLVEIHPAKPKSPNTLAHSFPPTPSASQPFSMIDYGPDYPIESPAAPGTSHSMRGMLKDPFETYNAPCYFDYWA